MADRTIEFKLHEKEEKAFNKLLKRFRFEVQMAITDKALLSTAKIVQRAARRETPVSRSSDKTTRDKWSMKVRQRFSTTISRDLYKSKVVRPKVKDPFALMGPKYPEGQIHYFEHPMKTTNRQRVYWGRRPSDGQPGSALSQLPSVTPKDNDYIKRACDESREKMASTFKRMFFAELKKRMQKHAS